MKKVYLIAVVVAIVAGFATYLFASDLSSKATIKDAKMVDVYVTLQDIDANKTITEDMFAEDAGYFELRSIVAADAVPNAVTDKEQLINMVTLDKFFAGEQMTTNRLEDLNGNEVALSLKLSEGMVAYSFSAGSVTSVDGYIVEGDTVDVMVTQAGDDGKQKSEVAYEGLKILRVSTSSESYTASQSGSTIRTYSTLTVEVTKEQAMELYDIENNYSFKLVLNPRN